MTHITHDNSKSMPLLHIGDGRDLEYPNATDEWETPQWLFDELSRIFGGFTLDPGATPQNAKSPKFFTREDDGLSQPWHGKVL
jgi:site-specific DNA-methyltransferase (adenine-specific)